MSDESKFDFYSMAIAAENKDDGRNWILEVTPYEMTTMMDGELNARGETQESTGTDAAGKVYADKVVTGNSIPAEWIGLGESNRLTAPNVRRGEELILYTYGDTGKVFWEPRNKNSHLRRLETITWAFSGTRDEGVKQLTEENSYTVELSTHEKHILISTSNHNGEKCRFFLQINPGKGIATLADDKDNEITIDSVGSRISLINGENVEVHLDRRNLNVKVPGNETHTVEGNVVINVSGNAQISAKGGVSITAPTIELNGSTSIKGGLSVSGTSSLNGASSPLPITAPNID